MTMYDFHWLLTLKALNDLAPNLYSSLPLINSKIPAHEYRLNPPTTKLKAFSDISSKLKGIVYLYIYIKLASSLTSFKSYLKTHHFRQNYETDCDN